MQPLGRTASLPRIPDALLALMLQALAWGAIAASGLPAGGQGWTAAGALAQGAAAAGLARLLGMAPWWLVLQAALPAAAWLLLALDIPSHWFLAAALGLVLVYWAPLRGRVPLFLSGRAVWAALADLLPSDRPFRFADLGCGVASAFVALAPHHGAASFVGYETAPLPWLASRLRTLRFGRRCQVRWQSLWQADVSRCDMVYAFLSPLPMPRLWAKLRAEMRPGSLFVSNAFPVPGVPAERVVEAGGTRLYLYRM